jgi:thioredoxin 2
VAGPLLDQLGKDNAGKLLVLKVNTDEHPQPSASLGIRSIPTFVGFVNGSEVGRQTGLPPAAAMKSWVEGLIAKG